MNVELGDLIQYKTDSFGIIYSGYGVIESLPKAGENNLLYDSIVLLALKSRGLYKQQFYTNKFVIKHNFGKITPKDFKEKYPERFILDFISIKT